MVPRRSRRPAERADPQALQLLLDAGANVESANAQGQTALMTVARTDIVEAAKVLVAHGANVNASEKWRGQNRAHVGQRARAARRWCSS